MYLSTKASRIRQREAQNARKNRAEIVRALSLGQITRRDLYKWGIFTLGGVLALKNGLSPLAKSAFAEVPTGTPLSPLFGTVPFSQPLTRLILQKPIPLIPVSSTDPQFGLPDPASIAHALFDPNFSNETLPSKRLSYHDDFSANPADPRFINPISGRGPIEGRAPTDPLTKL